MIRWLTKLARDASLFARVAFIPRFPLAAWGILWRALRSIPMRITKAEIDAFEDDIGTLGTACDDANTALGSANAVETAAADALAVAKADTTVKQGAVGAANAAFNTRLADFIARLRASEV